MVSQPPEARCRWRNEDDDHDDHDGSDDDMNRNRDGNLASRASSNLGLCKTNDCFPSLHHTTLYYYNSSEGDNEGRNFFSAFRRWWFGTSSSLRQKGEQKQPGRSGLA